jgi:hypothetical protein
MTQKEIKNNIRKTQECSGPKLGKRHRYTRKDAITFKNKAKNIGFTNDEASELSRVYQFVLNSEEN